MSELIKRNRMILTIASLLIGSVFILQANLRGPVAVTAIKAVLVTKPVTIIRGGTVERAVSLPVNIEFTGLASEIYVKEGQYVKQGQPLLKIEAAPVADESVASQPKANLPTKRAGYAEALNEFNRYQKLYELGAIPRQHLENAKERLQRAEQYSTDRNDAPPPTTQKTSALRGPIVVTAPIGAIVAGLTVASGKPVQAGQQLLTLGSGQELGITVKLEQRDINQVTLGSKVTLTVSGQTIAGYISSIVPEVKGQQVTGFLARITLANVPAGLLSAGMNVNVNLDTGKTASVLQVPAAAVLQDEQGQRFVFIAADGKAGKQAVVIGESNENFVDIVSGISPDTMVLTGNLAKLRNGSSIAVSQ